MKKSLTKEAALCQRLGIPDDARRVIIFAESSHWDPNWLYTSEQYFERFVRHNLDAAIAALQREPRRVYAIECVFFLRMYWERCPAQRDTIRALVNAGRLRLTSSGVTTPDTILPSAEAILRDWLIGQQWLYEHGMTQTPKLAYLTDSFGCSPFLPTLLNAAGFDSTAITRIDGMYFMGCDYESAENFPREGSSAARLLQDEKTLDFIWRDANGGEALCHWNAFTYGQGDMLTYRGLSRVYLFRVAVPDASEHNVARRIGQFVDQLAPYSRTRYMFCPIGFDFIAPIPDLVAILDRYNRLHYAEDGVWAVNAGLDDYLALVDQHREQLPTLALDPNPYWTGFYTARPVLKKRIYDLVDALTRAETLALAAGATPPLGSPLEGETHSAEVNAQLKAAWWEAVVANHHDFITGTSPDLVVEVEQIPWLQRATQAANAVIARLAPGDQEPHEKQPDRPSTPCPEWHMAQGHLEVRTPHYAVELTEEAGGSITRAWDPTTQRPLLTGVSNDVVSYQDTGGLWRMGHEFRGGHLREIARASDRPARFSVTEHETGLDVTCTIDLDGETVRRRMWFTRESPQIYFRVEGRAAEERTLTVRFATALSTPEIVMDMPGGIIRRPAKKIYDPTFWPLQHGMYIPGEEQDAGVTLWLSQPGAVAYEPGQYFEIVALRNATRERAFGFLTIPGMPATGHEREVHTLDYALRFTAPAFTEVALPYADDGPRPPWDDAAALIKKGGSLRQNVADLIMVDPPHVRVMAAKPATHREGIIVRLFAPRPPEGPVQLKVQGYAVKAAYLCDAREHDLRALDFQSDPSQLISSGSLTMSGAIATVRLQI
jgi:hypothetical protein